CRRQAPAGTSVAGDLPWRARLCRWRLHEMRAHPGADRGRGRAHGWQPRPARDYRGYAARRLHEGRRARKGTRPAGSPPAPPALAARHALADGMLTGDSAAAAGPSAPWDGPKPLI